MNTKTFRIKKEDLDKWLTALRSGEYKQGYGSLQDQNGGYCCLGVLQMALDGEVERTSRFVPGNYKPANACPSAAWAAQKGIYDLSDSAAESVLRFSAFNPIIMHNLRAAPANDCRQYNFCQIADMIEASAETY